MDFTDIKKFLNELPYLRELATAANTTEEIVLAAVLGGAVVLLFLILSSGLSLFRGSKADAILLLGLCGAGKTSLFYQLRDGALHQGTVTSMERNEGRFILKEEEAKNPKARPVHIIDCPGHPRLRARAEELLAQALGVVFVIDADHSDFMPQLHNAAEFLFDILTKKEVVRRRVPLLLLCNKMDKVSAHSVDFIRKQLEKEIDKLRSTRSALSDADVGAETSLGVAGKPFQFTQCTNKVTVADASVKENNLANAEQFIRSIVKP